MDDVTLDGERIKYWISNGAQVSDTVHNILVGQKIIEGKKINVLPKKSPIVKEVEETKEEVKEEVKEDVSEEGDEAVAPESTTEEAPVIEAPAEEIKEEASVEEVTPAPEETKKEEA